MKSWKTTVGGFIAGLGFYMSSQAEPWWFYKVGPIISLIGLTFFGATARDNNVPSEAIPSACKAADKIKRDTAFLQKPPEP